MRAPSSDTETIVANAIFVMIPLKMSIHVLAAKTFLIKYTNSFFLTNNFRYLENNKAVSDTSPFSLK